VSAIRVRDDRGRTLVWGRSPQRVASLVPSDSYTLVHIGAGARLVARTEFCVEPAAALEAVPAVGGTKNVDVDRLVALEPDVVFANQEENSRGDIMRMHEAGLNVFVSFPKTVAQGVAHMARMVTILGLAEEARDVVAAAYRAVAEAERFRDAERPVRTFVPIWMDPLMTVHGTTFISDVLALSGAENVFALRERRYPLAADLGKADALPPERVGERDVRYPRVTLDEVAAAQPELVLLPDEPHAFSEADAAVFRGLDIPAAKSGRIAFCNGRDLMWPGARSVQTLDRLRKLVRGGAASGR
jgi:ABC-type Fe3+-hydroxamate transport system substrate-binding protein